MKKDKFQLTITGITDEALIDAIAKRVIEITNPDFFKDQEHYYSVKEVARIANVTPQTIKKHIKNDLLLADKPGRDYRISESNLKLYINNGDN